MFIDLKICSHLCATPQPSPHLCPHGKNRPQRFGIKTKENAQTISLVPMPHADSPPYLLSRSFSNIAFAANYSNRQPTVSQASSAWEVGSNTLLGPAEVFSACRVLSHLLLHLFSQEAMTQAGQEIVTHKLLTKKLRHRRHHEGREWCVCNPFCRHDRLLLMELGQVKTNPGQVWHVLSAQLLSEFLVLMLKSDQLHKCQLLRQTKHLLPHQNLPPHW